MWPVGISGVVAPRGCVGGRRRKWVSMRLGGGGVAGTVQRRARSLEGRYWRTHGGSGTHMKLKSDAGGVCHQYVTLLASLLRVPPWAPS